MKREQLTSSELQTGMNVISFEPLGMIRVGRIHSAVTTYPTLQAILTGTFAEFDLLYADQHERAGALIWGKYFYRNEDAPSGSGVFQWPNGLMNLTFTLAESSLKMNRLGWLVHIKVQPPLGPTIILG
jgi:hypothetical protein